MQLKEIAKEIRSYTGYPEWEQDVAETTGGFFKLKRSQDQRYVRAYSTFPSAEDIQRMFAIWDEDEGKGWVGPTNLTLSKSMMKRLSTLSKE